MLTVIQCSLTHSALLYRWSDRTSDRFTFDLLRRIQRLHSVRYHWQQAVTPSKWPAKRPAAAAALFIHVVLTALSRMDTRRLGVFVLQSAECFCWAGRTHASRTQIIHTCTYNSGVYIPQQLKRYSVMLVFGLKAKFCGLGLGTVALALFGLGQKFKAKILADYNVHHELPSTRVNYIARSTFLT